MFSINKYSKYIFLGLVLGITYFLWGYTKIVIEQDFFVEDLLAYFSQLAALTAVILFSLNFVMSTRLYIVERFFYGLDKMYKVHRNVARVAFTLAWLHPILLLINNFYGIDTFKLYFVPGTSIFYNSGIVSLHIMTVLVLFSVTKFLPYHIWKNTHRFMFLVLIFLGIHLALNTGTIGSNDLFKFWMMSWVFIGIVSWIYVEFLYKRIGPVFYYKVSKVNILNSVTEIYLEPQNKPLLFKAGQFVFMSFIDNKEVGLEMHPYSISSNPHDYQIRISAKSLGDYSAKLTKAKQGDLVKLIGPYGYFTRERIKKTKKQIWIAGGIGVTPFLSMLGEEKDEPTGNKIKFFYSTKTDEESIYKEEILKNAENIKDLDVHINIDSKDGYLNAKRISEITEDSLVDYSVLICGPKVMMYSLKSQLKEIGLKDDQILFEDFALKPA